MHNGRKLILILLVSVITCSFVELYAFLALPIHVFRNGSFSENLDYWNSKILVGQDIINFSMNTTSERNSLEHFPLALTLTGKGTTWPAQNYVWVKLYQHTAVHSLVESSSLKLSWMINETNLERILSSSDAAVVYVGFMVSKNNTTKCFMVYAWVVHETNSTKITEDTFKEYSFWRIVSLERFNESLLENPVITFRRSIWQDLTSQGFSADDEWKFNEGIEIGIMLWNIRTFDFPWSVTIYLGCLDITYYWPVRILGRRIEIQGR